LIELRLDRIPCVGRIGRAGRLELKRGDLAYGWHCVRETVGRDIDTNLIQLEKLVIEGSVLLHEDHEVVDRYSLAQVTFVLGRFARGVARLEDVLASSYL
jgi:hypothetical protein